VQLAAILDKLFIEPGLSTVRGEGWFEQKKVALLTLSFAP
jgi:hypothetical protein